MQVEEVIDPNKLKVELFKRLDELITGKQLVDLHTHLLGMGSADFWLYRIMVTYLPRVCKIPPRADRSATTHMNELNLKITELLDYQLAARISQAKWTRFLNKDGTGIPVHWDKELARKTSADRLDQLATCFTDDVVYKAEFMFTVFNVASSTDAKDDLIVGSLTGKLRDMLYNSNHPTVFQTYFRHYIIFNARKATFELVLGLPNTALLQLMEFPTNGQPDQRDQSGKPSSQALTIRALVQNGFSMLENNGSQAGPTGLNNYRGRFTPEFYPKRFLLKDSIYEQRLEVLSILINQVASRYGKSGVNLVEFSLGANDLLNINVVKHLTMGKVFTKDEHPDCNDFPKDASDDDRRWADLAKKRLSRKPSEAPGTDVGDESSSIPSQKRRRLSADQASDPSSSAVGRQDTVEEVEEQRSAKKDFEASDEAHEEPSSEQEHSKVSEEEFEELSSGEEDIQDPDLRGAHADSIALRDWKNNAGGPSWRKHLGAYNEKPNGFRYYFLAAFNRGEHHLPNRDLDEEPDYLAASQNDALRYLRSHPERALQCTDTDQKIERIFPQLFLHDGPFTKLNNLMLTANDENKSLRHFWRHYVVGLDWVGDEYGHPFCALKHSIATSTVMMMRKRGRSRFGIRLHAGESVPHRGSGILNHEFMDDMFMIHMEILRKDIKFIHTKIGNKHLRIGHGVAFLHEQQDRARRQLRRRGIVCELNMTSNQYLLPMLYSDNPEHQGQAGSRMTLARFLDDVNLRDLVFLATDDDGIWPIRKCDLHYHHVSVAGEICRAIDTGCFNSEIQLENMVSLARKSAFS
ncbi:hypothetical protein DFS34DRAFT_651043 [Phlyctochytrium arcticum]|nr:hypothetical protein DFS34DRAFT_651043 [Phlyctochytrium arcticum]